MESVVQQDDWASYATICRLCLQRDGFMLGIFNHIQGREKSIYKKIMDCTALEVNNETGDNNNKIDVLLCTYANFFTRQTHGTLSVIGWKRRVDVVIYLFIFLFSGGNKRGVVHLVSVLFVVVQGCQTNVNQPFFISSEIHAL